MKISRRLGISIQFAAAVWLALAPQQAFAYEHPLTDDSVRQAYFLGQDVRQANPFLSQYLRPIPASAPAASNGARVTEIELSTPYAQVVEASALHTVGYSAQDAAADYRKHGDSISVRVKILFASADINEGDDFWRGVAVGLIQKQHMSATSITGGPIYESNQDGGSAAIGANVYVQFSVAGVVSAPIQVEVILPQGSPIHAAFDLKSLR